MRRCWTCSNGPLVVPVLTAHPTEVRRKSMIDHRNRIAELMQIRDSGRTETEEGDPLEGALLRQIALLWQTRPLRRERLYVTDEVESALAYMREVLPSGAAGALCALGSIARQSGRRAS
jgi:phosphoenolpyruvate carboxylase